MKVSDYKYYQPSFSAYNVAQSAVIPYLDKDLNLVISFSTATGKTVLAECCFAYHLSVQTNSRVAYVCPFKSLANEKYDEWCSNIQLSQYGIVLATSDSKVDISGFEETRIALVTLETFDAKTRTNAYKEWVSSLTCVVFDEAHILGDDGRGGAIESSMMRFSKANPNARLILLSATMSNAKEMAQWVKRLNGKATKCVVSSWRPTKIKIDYAVVLDKYEKIDEAVRLVLESPSVKIIVFVHSKVVGGEIVKRLRKAGIKSAFHNASVPRGRRRKIENAFNDRVSGLNVLVSTSTLGSGVNMS